MLTLRSVRQAAVVVLLISVYMIRTTRTLAIDQALTDNDSTTTNLPPPSMQKWEVPPMYRRNDAATPSFLYRELPVDDRDLQVVSGARPYGPIRIVFDTRPIESRLGESDALDDAITSIVDTVLPEAAAVWSRHLMVPQSPTSSSTLNVQPLRCGPEYAPFDSVPYTNADLVILVGGDVSDICGDGRQSRTLAYATPCQLHVNTDRPVLGAMNFCLDSSSNSNGMDVRRRVGNVPISDFYQAWTGATLRADHVRGVPKLDTAVHEMAHILGQSELLFLFFRDGDGRPRTERDDRGSPVARTTRCGNGTVVTGVIPSDETVQVVEVAPSSSISTNEGQSSYEQYLVTPKVQSVARNHFNCSRLLGGRLEDREDSGCLGSHWHERHFYNSLMSPAASAVSANGLSIITLALMEDSGWYRVNYDGGVQPPFGIGAGCEFVEEDCIDRSTELPPEWVVDEFCAIPLEVSGFSLTLRSLNHVFCDTAYQSWTVCDLIEYPNGEAASGYFASNPRLGPLFFPIADACPIPDIGLGLDCRINAEYNVFYPGETVGETSRCLNAYSSDDDDGSAVFRPACMNLFCDEETRTVVVGSKGGEPIVCEFDGQEIAFAGRDGAFLVCPRLASVCPELFACPNACSGRGDCRYEGKTGRPYCECYDVENLDPACSDGVNGAEEPSLSLSTSQPSSKPVSSTTMPSTSSTSTTQPSSQSSTAVPALTNVESFPTTPTIADSRPVQPADANPVAPQMTFNPSTSAPSLQNATDSLSSTPTATSELNMSSSSRPGEPLTSESKNLFPCLLRLWSVLLPILFYVF